ncbi:hypothetical protein [Pseudomonas vranovensis]|nr:hypothetical protein [Pseudomonas vranovensis]
MLERLNPQYSAYHLAAFGQARVELAGGGLSGTRATAGLHAPLD